MYIPAAFTMSPEDAKSYAIERSFGLLVATEGGRPHAVHVPFRLVESESGLRVDLHVARANPIHEVIARSPEVLIAVSGPDAYVSPDWYASADQVPTWNYVAVEIAGRARVLPLNESEPLVTALSDAFEERLVPKKPWRMSKLTERRKAMLLQAIVSISIDVERIEGAAKLSQNKSADDQEGVLKMLSWKGGWADGALSERMRKLQVKKA